MTRTTARKRAEAAYQAAVVARKLAPKGYRMMAQAKLELACRELLKRELRRR